MVFRDHKKRWWESFNAHIAWSLPEASDYELAERGASRHGSWEWTFARRDAEERINRYVIVAVTPLTTTPRETAIFDINIWIGADDDHRYVRRWVRSQQVHTWERERFVLDDLVQEALLQSEALGTQHLDQRYLRASKRTVSQEESDYRRRVGADTWHFCRNCSHWPSENFEESVDSPQSGHLCNECSAKERSGNCEGRR